MFKQQFWTRLIQGSFGAIACFGVWLSLAFPTLANQELYQSALLIPIESSTSAAIYPDPSREQAPLGYGEAGDKIWIVEEIYNNDGERWDRIRLTESPQLEGWIVDANVKRDQDNSPSSNPYLQPNFYYSQDHYSQGQWVQQRRN
ncbi:MAG: hypothetical protein VKJ02_18235 [Snowella sp.]|nr:hypothetical protein [Snowella sp.]